jgi:hypothetical protein
MAQDEEREERLAFARAQARERGIAHPGLEGTKEPDGKGRGKRIRFGHDCLWSPFHGSLVGKFRASPRFSSALVHAPVPDRSLSSS